MADIDEGKVRSEFAKLWQHRKQPRVRGRLWTLRDYAEDFYLARARHDAAEIAALKTRVAKLTEACRKSENEIEQTLGKALGYPWYKDDKVNFPDATEKDGVCVGDHVAGSLAMEAADRIAKLEARGGKWLNIVFDGTPWSGSGRFVGVENASGNPINFDECIHTVDGYCVLRIYPPSPKLAAPEGWQLVPKEATQEMIKAAEKQWMVGSNVDMASREWSAMLAAAPAPEQKP